MSGISHSTSQKLIHVPESLDPEEQHDWEQMRKIVRLIGDDVSVLQPTLSNVVSKWYSNVTKWF